MIRRGRIVVAPRALRYGGLPGGPDRLYRVDRVIRESGSAVLLPYPEHPDCPAGWEALADTADCRVATREEREEARRLIDGDRCADAAEEQAERRAWLGRDA